MPNPRSTRQRKRRGASLEPHEVALLLGEPQPGMSEFALLGMACGGSVCTATTPAALDRLEAHLDLAPEGRRAMLAEWIARLRTRERRYDDELPDPALELLGLRAG